MDLPDAPDIGDCTRLLDAPRAVEERVEDARADERKFMEDLVNKRVTVLLTTFGLAMTAAGLAKTKELQAAVLAAIGLLAALLAMTISRAQLVLDAVMSGLPRSHPAVVAAYIACVKITRAEVLWPQPIPKDDDPAPRLRLPPLWLWSLVRASRRRIIGYGIPWVVVGLLFIGACLSWHGVFISESTRFDRANACGQAAEKWEKRTDDAVIEVFYSPVRGSCVCDVPGSVQRRLVDCLSRETLQPKGGQAPLTERQWDLLKDSYR